MTEQKAYLEPSDVDALIEAAPTLRDRAIIRMLFKTDLRVTELISIEVPAIDLENGWVTIQDKKCIRLNCPHCGGLVEMQNNRRVSLDADILAMVKEYLEKRSKKQELRLFALTRQRVQQIVHDAAEAAGLDGKILSTEERQRKKPTKEVSEIYDEVMSEGKVGRQDEERAMSGLQNGKTHTDN